MLRLQLPHQVRCRMSSSGPSGLIACFTCASENPHAWRAAGKRWFSIAERQPWKHSRRQVNVKPRGPHRRLVCLFGNTWVIIPRCVSGGSMLLPRPKQLCDNNIPDFCPHRSVPECGSGLRHKRSPSHEGCFTPANWRRAGYSAMRRLRL